MTATPPSPRQCQRVFPTTDSQTKTLAKITKLLAVAHSQAGTPEAVAFHEMAMRLMAEYAIAETRLTDAQGKQGRIIERHFRIVQGYRRQRSDLLLSIADALHCTAVGLGLASQPEVVIVFGKRHHVDRVALLYHYLVLDMVAGAGRYARQLQCSGAVLRRAKESWMVGYAHRIHERLTAIEHSHTQELASTRDKPGALVLQDDREKAHAAREQRFPSCRRRERRRKVIPGSFSAGRVAAQGANLLQQRRGHRDQVVVV